MRAEINNVISRLVWSDMSLGAHCRLTVGDLFVLLVTSEFGNFVKHVEVHL